MPLIGDKSCEY